jgi:serine/threonine protein kinase
MDNDCMDNIFISDEGGEGGDSGGRSGGSRGSGSGSGSGDGGRSGGMVYRGRGSINDIIFYDKSNNLSLTCDVGSSIYRAPELEREYKYYNNKIDVYSLGIIFIEMLLVNFNTQYEKYKYITAIINNRKKPLPYLITNDYDEVIINMICKNHNKRISINNINIIYKDNKKVYNCIDN